MIVHRSSGLIEPGPAVEGGAATDRPSLVVMAFCLLLVLLALWMG